MIRELELIDSQDMLLELRSRCDDSVFIMNCEGKASSIEFPILILASNNPDKNIRLCETAIQEFADCS